MNATASQHGPHATAPQDDPHATTRSLNAMDRSMVLVKRALKRIDCPDFSTQAFLWLGERIDVARLRHAIGRLCVRYPVLASRLRDVGRRGLHWECLPGASCPLQEIEMESPTPEAVLRHAAERLGTPGDPATDGPIRFELLHRPDGRDVLMMQYHHALMDNADALPLLRELNRFCEADDNSVDEPAPEMPDLLEEYLKRFTQWQRFRASLRTIDVRFRQLRGEPALFGQEMASKPVQFAIATRRLDPAASRAFERRVVEVCGIPGTSMALLGSVFRALDRVRPNQGSDRQFRAGIGVDLLPSGVKRPVFQTVASVVPIAARSADLRDPQELMRALNQQLRTRLGKHEDLGTIALAQFFLKPRRVFRNWFAQSSVRDLMRDGYSIWYAYFGSLDAIGERFCGATIDEFHYCASSWFPVGVTLLVNRFRGHLMFQATYVSNLISESLVNDFLDATLADLAD